MIYICEICHHICILDEQCKTECCNNLEYFEFTDAEYFKAEYGKQIVTVKDLTGTMREIEDLTLKLEQGLAR